MATILGNLFLFILCICVISLFYGPLSRPAPGGDAAVGYAFTVIFTSLIIAASVLFIIIATNANSGYAFIKAVDSQRFLLLAGVTICMVVGMIVPILVRFEYKAMADWMQNVNHGILMIMTIGFVVTHFVFLNAGLREQVPASLIQKLFYGVAGTGAFVVFIALVSYFRATAINQQREVEAALKFEDKIIQDNLNNIDSCDVEKDMVFILVYTTKYQDPEVRRRAIAKIKTHPEWEKELMRRLDSGWASEVFNFLSANDVDHPEAFLEPINAGILNESSRFRDRIRGGSHPSHFYPSMFDFNGDRIIQTLMRFERYNYDYKPAMLELKAALHEHSDFATMQFNFEKKIDQWIKTH